MIKRRDYVITATILCTYSTCGVSYQFQIDDDCIDDLDDHML